MEIKVSFHPHALSRMSERGASEEEVAQTVCEGEKFQAKFGRTGFRRNFSFGSLWQDRQYANKQIEAFAAQESEGWLVITVIVRYF